MLWQGQASMEPRQCRGQRVGEGASWYSQERDPGKWKHPHTQPKFISLTAIIGWELRLPNGAQPQLQARTVRYCRCSGCAWMCINRIFRIRLFSTVCVHRKQFSVCISGSLHHSSNSDCWLFCNNWIDDMNCVLATFTTCWEATASFSTLASHRGLNSIPERIVQHANSHHWIACFDLTHRFWA